MTQPALPTTLGIHHIGLSVSRLGPARQFFVDVLGFRIVWERPDYPSAMVTDGAAQISLWQVEQAESSLFDRRRNEGLHHLALAVGSTDGLNRLHDELLRRGVPVEFPPQLRADGKAVHMMCHMPGGPRLEFIAAVAAA